LTQKAQPEAGFAILRINNVSNLFYLIYQLIFDQYAGGIETHPHKRSALMKWKCAGDGRVSDGRFFHR
jgi:hypothetical protein